MTTRRLVLLVVALAILARLPFLTVLPSPDEAGLLIVGGQWHDGTSLYGDYWVDRPPLLMGLAELAARTGGAVALRLLGLVAVALTVVACAATAHRLAGDRAARWAAVAAAVLTVSPWLGADRVNAELLAAPWLAVGVYAAVRAVEHGSLRWSVLTGVAGMGAVMTKQNHADAAVFAVVLLVASVIARDVPARRALAMAGVAAAGALALAAALLLWAWARGTDPAALGDALFAFRLRADEVMATDRSDSANGRQYELLGRSLVSGQLLLVLATVAAPVLRRCRAPAWWALSAMALFAAASVLAGGSWWSHYLVEFAVPVSVATGLLAARSRRVVPVVVASAVAAGVVGGVLIHPALTTVDGAVAAGRMVGQVADPGDTVVSAWGRPDLVAAAGLGSPYEHLWSLPVRTDDPALREFTHVLSGPDAPTWVVSNGTLGTWGLTSDTAERELKRRYRLVAGVCTYRIWLRNDVRRPVPERPTHVECAESSRLR